jgi:hypothetical protein
MSVRRVSDTNDEPCKKKARMELSSMMTDGDFGERFPLVEIVTKPSLNPSAALTTETGKALAKSFVENLVACAESVYVNNEVSRYPYVTELLKIFARLTDQHISSNEVAEQCQVMSAEEMHAEVDHFVDLYGRRVIESEPTEDIIQKWESYADELERFKVNGYIEFSMESKEHHVVRWVVECRDWIESVSGVTNVEGFYQAAAVAVINRDDNMHQAGRHARSRAVADFVTDKDNELVKALDAARQAKQAVRFKTTRAERQKIAADLARAEADLKAAVAAVGDEADEDAQDKVFEQPVWVTLTDVRRWVFLRITGNKIEVSKSHCMFDLSHGEITPMQGFLSGLALICDAAGINLADPQLVQKLDSAKKRTGALSAQFLESVFGAANAEAFAAFCALHASSKPEEEIRAYMREHFLEVPWEELVQMRQAAPEKVGK